MRQRESAFNRKAKLLTKYLMVVLEPVPYAHVRSHRGFWRSSNNIYVKQFLRPWACIAFRFHLKIVLSYIPCLRRPQLIFGTCLAMLLLFCCEPFYSPVTPLLWLHTIKLQFNTTDWCILRICECYICWRWPYFCFMFMNILSMQSYSTACIRVWPQCTWIFRSRTQYYVGQFVFTWEFGSVSPCVFDLLVTSETLGWTFTLL